MIAASVALAFVFGPLAGSSDIAAIAGHGGVSAGVNHAGVLAVLRWPNPGGPDQLLQPKADSIEGGGRWGIRTRNKTLWVGGPEARVTEVRRMFARSVECIVDWPDFDAHARVAYFVLAGSDVLLSTISVTGLDSPPELVWRSEWAPRTRLVPEFPYGDGAFDRMNGLAAIVGDDRVWHVRPGEPSRDLLRRASELAARTAPVHEWSALLGDGVWIGVTGGQSGQLENGGEAIARVGPAASFVRPDVEEVSGAFNASVAITTASTLDAALAMDQLAARREATGLVAGLPDPIQRLDSARYEFIIHGWHTLQSLRDPRSGRVVRGISVDPPLARDWPRHGAWIALAYLDAGEVASAQSILDHYLVAVRDTDITGQPFGSLAESYYTNGEIASPRFIVDDLGPARVLFAVRKVALSMPEDDADQWIRRRAESIGAAGEFLVSWVDSRQGAPLWSPDPIAFTDSDTQTRVFDHFAGMNAAIELTRSLGRPLPEHWLLRRDRLRDLVDRIVTTPSTGWTPARGVIWDIEGLSPELLDSVLVATRSAIETRAADSPSELANLALQAALLPDNDSLRDLALTHLIGFEVAPDAELAARLVIAGLHNAHL